MSFASRLVPAQVAINPSWRGFDATVDGLIDCLIGAGSVPAGLRSESGAAVRAREHEASTAVLETGVGVPHARITGLARPAVALAVAARGLYEAAPTVRIRIVALVLSPVAALDEHLRTLADVATLLHSSDLRALLLRAGDPAAALDVIQRFSRAMP